MSDVALFSALPKAVLKSGLVLPFNVYVFLPQNQSLIHYRKIGDRLDDRDFQFFQKISAVNLMIPRAEVALLKEFEAKNAFEKLKSGDAGEAEVSAAAASTLNSVMESENIAEAIETAGAFVQSLISQFKESSSSQAYQQALKWANLPGHDPLTVHQQQVSSISVLMALSIGKFSMEDLADLAAAGLLHDMGMWDIGRPLGELHINMGVVPLTEAQATLYYKHIDQSLERIRLEDIEINPGMKRIIELHHENWNGSGYKKFVGNKIYRPARVLRIADDFVGMIQISKGKARTFQECIFEMKLRAGLYDPEMIEVLHRSLT